MRRREFIAFLGSAVALASGAAGQSRIPKIGVLAFGYPDPSAFLAGLRDGLHHLGYEEGRSVELIIRSAGGKLSTLFSLASELVNLKVDIIVALPTTAGIAARQATTEIPIVVEGGDLEATGLVTSLAHPGGNVTGVSAVSDDIATKSLELILEMLPEARRVAVLVNADSRFGAAMLQQVQAAAAQRKIETKGVQIGEADKLEAIFAALDEWKAEALLVHPALPQKSIAAFALKHRLPAVSPTSIFCEAGGLASYSADIKVLAAQCGVFVDKILKGRRPSELPVELPTRFRIAVNLQTAKAIGLDVPQTLLARADEVIE
jgi:putative tryptophan/tyrosine transport system substrate-binding protein